MDKKNILVFGANGYLGSSFVEIYSDKYNFDLWGGMKAPSSMNKWDMLNKDTRTFSKDMLKYGKYDAVLFMHGLGPRRGVKDITYEEFIDMVRISLIEPMCVLRNIAEVLNQDATVVFMSSGSAKGGSYDPSYASVKGALPGFMKSLKRVYPHIRFNGVLPALIENSPIHKGMTPDFEARQRAAMNGKLVDVKDVCMAIDLLINAPCISDEIIEIHNALKL
jgi:NAD(P)-dependent dehydrogenase (short-subunit alcohol dehydrogenase family)